jgi:hypothetical protein
MAARSFVFARLAVGLAALAPAALASGVACADDTIKRPGDHPTYGVEIEPHILFGWDNLFPGNSFGVGARFGIPIVQNGFIDSINNSVAISFGADLLHYDGCYIPNGSCSANFLFLPVAMQWNFYVAQKWSVFGEPGLFIYHGFFDACPAGLDSRFCLAPNATGLRPALYAGGRYHFSEHVALTMRIGYPTFSVGVSFL